MGLRINVPPIVSPVKGARYTEMIGPYGQYFKNMICKHVMPSNEIHFNKNEELNREFQKTDENVYLFSKEGNSQWSSVIFVEVMIKESELPEWILIS